MLTVFVPQDNTGPAVHPCDLTVSTESYLKADLTTCSQIFGVSGSA